MKEKIMVDDGARSGRFVLPVELDHRSKQFNQNNLGVQSDLNLRAV